MAMTVLLISYTEENVYLSLLCYTLTLYRRLLVYPIVRQTPSYFYVKIIIWRVPIVFIFYYAEASASFDI